MPSRKIYKLLLVFFFFSGVSSLIYEVLWIREFSLIFGATTHAISAVFAAFMTGLACGSRLGGSLADRLIKPRRILVVFASLAGLIVVYGILFPPLYSRAAQWSSSSGMAGNSLAWDTVIKFSMALALLLLPTTCMGATFPLLSRLLPRDRAKGQWLGDLYGINTLGAATGAAVTGYLFIELLGLPGTFILAIALNILVCLGGLFLGKVWRDETSSPSGCPPPPSLDPPLSDTPLPYWLLIALMFVSGGASLFGEVAWSRTLHLVLGSSTYAITTVLVVFLLGIALGGGIYSRLISGRNKLEETLLILLCFTVLEIGRAHV